MPLLANYHTHTSFCDGRDAPEEVIQYALELGFFALGFSGHMDADIHMDQEKYYEEIHRLQDKYKDQIEILCGIELDNLYDPAAGQGADYVIGSTHFLDLPMDKPASVDNSAEMLVKMAHDYYGGDYYRLSRDYYDLSAKVYDRLHCDFVGHFDLITRFNDQLHFLDESSPTYYKPALEAMEYLVGQGVPFEINCGAVNRNRKRDFYPNRFLLKALHDFGGEIIINSDAHEKERLNGAFDQAVAAAIECGFTHTNVLTKGGGDKVIFRQLALDLL